MESEIKSYYEEWWENPDDPRDIIFKNLNEVVSERLPRGKGKRALDIGSGKGKIVSFLQRNGYEVTAVELNENFTSDLKRKFPDANVIEGDFNEASVNGTFDVVTAIEFIQNLDKEALNKFLKKVDTLTNQLIINISNRHSLHGFWAIFRGFQKSFVYTYTPVEIEKMLEETGFRLTFKKGIGLVTPLTLLPGFKLKIIPAWFARAVNLIGDRLFPRSCHLYYIEAIKYQEDEN